MNDMLVNTDTVAIETACTPEFSWRAVFAGALVASSVILFLLLLGAGLGLSLVSAPETDANTVRNGLTLGAIYFFAAQAFGLAVGGYIAGRVMGPVLESESEEIFQSSAHGLVVWALGVVATAATIAMAGLIFAGFGLTATAILEGPSSAKQQAPSVTEAATGYWVDTLFRPVGAAPQPPATQSEARAEVSRILTVGLSSGERLSQPDHDRVVALVSQSTGADAAAANGRVDDVLTRIRQQEAAAAETARRLARNLSLWLAASLIFGALVASAAAVSGRWVDDQARLARP